MSPQIVIVTLKNAMDINIGDVTTSDPFVYVATVQPGAAPKTLSLYKSEYISKTLSPVWNEQAIACYVTMQNLLVLTIADHDMMSAPDFLGQVSE